MADRDGLLREAYGFYIEDSRALSRKSDDELIDELIRRGALVLEPKCCCIPDDVYRRRGWWESATATGDDR